MPTMQQAIAELGYNPSADLIAAFDAALESSTVTVQAGHTGVVVGRDEGWNLVSWAIDENNPERPVLNYKDEHLITE